VFGGFWHGANQLCSFIAAVTVLIPGGDPYTNPYSTMDRALKKSKTKIKI